MKQKFNIIQSTCIPIQIDNCNTDLIIPARYLASTTRDPKFFGDAFMHDLRFDAEGNAVSDFVMNKAEYSEEPKKGVHEIIIGGQNWGSGSSREHAPIALINMGASAVLADSFARIFFRNGINLGLPLIVCKGIAQHVQDGQTVRLNILEGTVTIEETGEVLQAEALGDKAMEILSAGGIKPMMKEKYGN
jgi:3-isopropylmalate dehydratase small subunit